MSALNSRLSLVLVLTLQIFGKKDTHVPPAGRDLIRKTMHDAGVVFSFYEHSHAQRQSASSIGIAALLTSTDAFIRDELSKGRYDPAVSGICFQMLLELFGRVLRSDLGPAQGLAEPEHVC